MSYSKKSIFLAATALSLVPFVAHAQDDAAASQGVVMEDVVVTATRREERLQQVPISVTAMDSGQLQKANIANPKQLTTITANMRMAQSTPEMQPIIRGVSNTAVNVGDDANVPTYIDGVFVAAMSQTTQDLLEVQRIEVLRGPQGTLFGRNATGGLINIITKEPSSTPGGHVKVQAGSYGMWGINGYVTGALTDTLTADLAAIYTKDNGWIKDLVRGGKADEKRSYGYRGKLRFEPNDRMNFTAAISYTNWDDPTSSAFQPVNGNTASRNPALGGNVNNIVANEPWTVAANIPPELRGTTSDVSLKAEIDLGFAELYSTTSAARYTYAFVADNDAGVTNLSVNANYRHQKAYTQELRLGSVGEGPLKWTAGVFGYYTEADTNIHVGATMNPPYLLNLQPHVMVASWAPFAEATYKVTPEINLTVGARYTSERRKLTQQQAGRTLFTLSPSYGKFTPRAILQWVPNSRFNTYVSYSRGFKSGTFNTYAATAVPVKPETLDAFEAGFKSDPLSWLRVNGAAFTYRYKNMQVSARDPVTGTLSLGNAGRAKIYGGELEAIAKVNADLTLRGSVGYQHGRYTEFGPTTTYFPLTSNGVPVGGNRTALVDATGKVPIRAPATTASLSAEYGHDFSFGEAGASGVIYYSGKRYWDFANVNSSPSYTMLNAQIYWKPTDKVRLSAWVDNITDKAVENYRSFSTAATYATYEPPRRFGVSVDYSF